MAKKRTGKKKKGKKPEESARLAPEAIETLYARVHEERPNPTTDLKYGSTFELLVAVILSAQSTDVGVNKVTEKLYPVANTPAAILELGEDGLKEYLRTLGLFNNKTKNVLATCRMLLDDYDGQVPDSRKELVKLPGVGRKTANVVLNVAFDQPTIPVDTHIHRVANRTGMVTTTKPGDTEKGLLAVTPDRYRRLAHHLLILHGRYVCKARKPQCPECTIRDLCLYAEKTTA